LAFAFTSFSLVGSGGMPGLGVGAEGGVDDGAGADPVPALNPAKPMRNAPIVTKKRSL